MCVITKKERVLKRTRAVTQDEKCEKNCAALEHFEMISRQSKRATPRVELMAK